MTDDTPATGAAASYGDLRALFINCTLKRSPDREQYRRPDHPQPAIMEKQGVRTEVIRAVDHDIATGVYPDMTEHGWASRRVAGVVPSRCWRPTSWCWPARSGWATTPP